MSVEVDCRVTIDGTRLPDGSPADDPSDPTALSGLSVVWGRSSTVEQPSPSTCTFTVSDPFGGMGWRTILTTGLPVQVTADTTVYPDPTESTFVDPSFEDASVGDIVSTIGNSVVRVASGGTDGTQHAQMLPDATHPTMYGYFPPAPFSDAVGAWDAIPATKSGQSWSISVDVRSLAAYPGGFWVCPVLFSDPTGRHRAVLSEYTVWADADGTWQTINIDGVLIQQTGVWVGIEVYLRPVSWFQMPPGQSWADTPGSWIDYDECDIDNIRVLAPAGGTDREVLVFAGRITDLTAEYDDTTAGVLIDVTAQDFTADLDNVRVGDVPWLVETVQARADHIINASGRPVQLRIDETVQDTLVSYQDVDSQPATDLLKDLAQSVDAVLWSAVHQTLGEYLHIEDQEARPAMEHLELVDGLVEIVAGALDGRIDISACDALRDPVSWKQDVTDVSTRVAVGWLEQGVDDDGKIATTDRTETVIDAALETIIGQRGFSVSTLLQDNADAYGIAERILARSSDQSWRVEGLTVDGSILPPTADTNAMVITLLDGTARNGAPIHLTDLPAWTPVGTELGVFLEGGTYSYTDGCWILELTVSSASHFGASLAWDDLDPAWAWDQFDPTIAWYDLNGVGPTPELGAAA